MLDWWWILFAALAIIVLVEFFIMRRRDAGLINRSVIDSTGTYPGERETDRMGRVSDEDRASEMAGLERNRRRQEPGQPPWGD